MEGDTLFSSDDEPSVTKRFKVSEQLAKVYNITHLEKKQKGALY